LRQPVTHKPKEGSRLSSMQSASMRLCGPPWRGSRTDGCATSKPCSKDRLLPSTPDEQLHVALAHSLSHPRSLLIQTLHAWTNRELGSRAAQCGDSSGSIKTLYDSSTAEGLPHHGRWTSLARNRSFCGLAGSGFLSRPRRKPWSRNVQGESTANSCTTGVVQLCSRDARRACCLSCLLYVKFLSGIFIASKISIIFCVA
jgi:hypothetical protein